MGTSEDISRAEFPPARYWRRWCADADPPSMPDLQAEADPGQAARAAVPGPASTAAESGEPPYRVLIVEDDRSQALFAQSVLAGAGIQAQGISDAAQVMGTLESLRPDLVLMDLHMPAIDGAELTDMIRAHPTLAHTPIVFLTGDPDPERQFEVLEIGADDFLTKPVRPRHLVAAVENRIMRARQQQARRSNDAGGVALRPPRAEPRGIARHPPPSTRETAPGGLAEQLASAVAERRLELTFQPIVAVAGGDDAQYQTLLRLRDADGALHPAGELLPIAESTGLMQEIDQQVLEAAISTLGSQQKLGTAVRLFVSQSSRSLSRDGYADWLVQTLAAAGAEGPALVVDVRQDDALAHAISLQEFSSKMVAAGVQLCLSHYCPGSEVDALLNQLPLSFVRLSPDFSSKLGDSAVRDRMREAIERAHRHGLLVIGQQVEDPQAAATLWMSGIDFIQGNLVQQAAGELDFDFQLSVL